MSFINVTYSEHKELKKRNRHYNPATSKMTKKWSEREFIAWDGEGTQVISAYRPTTHIEMGYEIFSQLGRGDEFSALQSTLPPLGNRSIHDRLWDLDWQETNEPQPYVLLANSKGEYRARKEGLGTVQCLEFILNTKEFYPVSTFVGFSFGYDTAQILKDLSEHQLWYLYNRGRVSYLNYYLKWLPGKWLTISDRHTKGRSATIYDVFGYFQSSFIVACEEYLGKDDPGLTLIREGKAARNVFTWDELHNFIIPYNRMELDMLVRIMNLLRTDFHNIDLNLTRWYGPGGVANKLFAKHHIKDSMTTEVPREVGYAAQSGYAGGRFEQFQLGRHDGTVYEYDICSAYPAAALDLPTLSGGTWHFTTSFKPETFGIWYCCYRSEGDTRRPEPLFCRSEDGSISYPTEVYGWYWTPEANLVPDSVQCGYYLEPATDERPFSFVGEMYEQRRAYKAAGNPTQRAIKLCLNSLYGKLAQRVGRGDKAPTYHQLEWAGWITSKTRAAIYKAIMLNPQAIIASETDAVFSTEPLDLDIGKGLGQWECSTFKEITYIQNGFYYAVKENDEVVCKYRGMDPDRATKQPLGLPYRSVVDHLRHPSKSPYGGYPPLLSHTTRFVNIGLALRTNSIFRTWETRDTLISIDADNGKHKRQHMIRCDVCKTHTLAECLHPMTISGYSGYSHHHRLPWVDPPLHDEYEYYLSLEEADQWQ